MAPRLSGGEFHWRIDSQTLPDDLIKVGQCVKVFLVRCEELVS